MAPADTNRDDIVQWSPDAFYLAGKMPQVMSEPDMVVMEDGFIVACRDKADSWHYTLHFIAIWVFDWSINKIVFRSHCS